MPTRHRKHGNLCFAGQERHDQRIRVATMIGREQDAVPLPHRLSQVVDTMQLMRYDPFEFAKIPRDDTQRENHLWKKVPSMRRDELVRFLNDDVLHESGIAFWVRLMPAPCRLNNAFDFNVFGSPVECPLG